MFVYALMLLMRLMRLMLLQSLHQMAEPTISRHFDKFYVLSTCTEFGVQTLNLKVEILIKFLENFECVFSRNNLH